VSNGGAQTPITEIHTHGGHEVRWVPRPAPQELLRKAETPRRCDRKRIPLCTQMERPPAGNTAKGEYGRRWEGPQPGNRTM